MTIQDFQTVYSGNAKSVTTKVDGITVKIKAVKNKIELRVNGEYKAETVSDFDLFDEIIKETILDIKETEKYYNDCERYNNELKACGAKNFSHEEMKSFLQSLIPDYIGDKNVAQSGSEYWLINNKTVRFSDHTRPATSKWNFIHGTTAIDCIVGLLTFEMLHEWIYAKLGIDVSLSEINKQF